MTNPDDLRRERASSRKARRSPVTKPQKPTSAALAYIEHRLNYSQEFRSKFPDDFRSGFNSAESGECCKKCVMLAEHYNGHGDAIKSIVGCRNPFQLPRVCECHLANRQLAEQAIVAELKNMRSILEHHATDRWTVTDLVANTRPRSARASPPDSQGDKDGDN